MYHSFIHHNIRIHIELRESSDAWAWTCGFDDRLIRPLVSEKTVKSVSEGLRLACLAARRAVEKHREKTRLNMTDKNLGLYVEASPTCINKYFWVITERHDPNHPTEVAASLEVYDRPSEAYRAGELVLHSLASSTSLETAEKRNRCLPAASSNMRRPWTTLH